MAKPRVFVSTIVDAPIEKVWPIIRDFNALPYWQPVVAKSEIEGGKPVDQLGCIRRMVTQDGAIVRETLLSLDDLDYSVTYDMCEIPYKFTNYYATIRCRPVTMQPTKTYIERYAFFDTDNKQDEEAMVKAIRDDVFIQAFNTLNQKLRES